MADLDGCPIERKIETLPTTALNVVMNAEFD
jgi:hypothetical protein